MKVPVTEGQIRTLAFYLWEQDGGPDGRSEEYWGKAREQLGESEGSIAGESAQWDVGPETEKTRPLQE